MRENELRKVGKKSEEKKKSGKAITQQRPNVVGRLTTPSKDEDETQGTDERRRQSVPERARYEIESESERKQEEETQEDQESSERRRNAVRHGG